jgi:putative aldouronate transport system permease protein
MQQLVKPSRKRFLKRLYESRYLWILITPALIYYALFEYGPMFGLVVAFKDYQVFKGIWQSEWVGLKYFRILILENPDFWPLVRNTFLLGFYSLLFGFPPSIILALLLNELKSVKFKRIVQTVSYLPHFISNVIVTSMVLMFLSPDGGMVNVALEKLFGLEPIYFMSKPELFRTVYIASGIWQGAGWGSIVYLAAISGIDPTQYEAASLDGAGRWRKMWHITIPGIMPIMVVLLILNIGGLFSTGFEKVMLLYNPMTYETADIFSTYTYRAGMQRGNFSYATAVGMFNGTISFILIIFANSFARRVRETSLW